MLHARGARAAADRELQCSANDGPEVLTRAPRIGHLYGVGLGPGDPELVTVKAFKTLAKADAVAFFTKRGQLGRAHATASPYLNGQEEIALTYPLTTEVPFHTPAYQNIINAFYTECEQRLGDLLANGKDVALICEGDPLFYGSFMHLYVRLRQRFASTIVPGVTGMSGCWTAAKEPMTWGDDVLTVLPATLSQASLEAHLVRSDAAVIMKIGSYFQKVRAAVEATGLLERAYYVERATTGSEHVSLLTEKSGTTAPYFSIILIPSAGQRR